MTGDLRADIEAWAAPQLRTGPTDLTDAFGIVGAYIRGRNDSIDQIRAILDAHPAGESVTEWGVQYPDSPLSVGHTRRGAESYAGEFNRMTDGGAIVVTRQVTPWTEVSS